MASTPFDKMLDALEWKPLETPEVQSESPYALLNICGHVSPDVKALRRLSPAAYAVERRRILDASGPLVRSVAMRVYRKYRDFCSIDLDDLVQDGYVGMAAAVDAYVGSAPFLPYAVQTIKGHILNGLKKNIWWKGKHWVRDVERDGEYINLVELLPSAIPSPPEILEGMEAESPVLPSDLEFVLRQFYESGKTIGEIASMLDIKPSQSRSLLEDGRAFIRRAAKSGFSLSGGLDGIRPLPTAPVTEIAGEKSPSVDGKRSPRTRTGYSHKRTFTKQARYRQRLIESGRCPHCGRPCQPYYECEDMRRKRRERYLRRKVG